VHLKPHIPERIKLFFYKDKELYFSLNKLLGFYPHNISLYKQALLHKSIKQTDKVGHRINNERLEFLGDSILSAVVSDVLYRHFPGKREGVVPPERSLQGHEGEHHQHAKLRHVARQGGEEDAHRGGGEQTERSAREEQCNGALDWDTPRTPRTMRVSDRKEAISTTRAIDQTLESMIWAGVTGITSRCSMVPCSRSRISAAPVRMMDSSVMWLMICTTEPNQALSRAGLKRARKARSTGGAWCRGNA
jgi:hypothetical protein